MNVSKISRIVVACLLPLALVACDIVFIAGPKTVKNGETVQYQILVPALEAASSATVYLTGNIPSGWSLPSAQYQTSASGGMAGDCTIHGSNPEIITDLPPVPPGHRRVYLSAGPFSTINGNDSGTALLNFVASGAAGNYSITFWAGVDSSSGSDQGESSSTQVSVMAPNAPPNALQADGFEFGTLAGWTRWQTIDPSTVAFYPFEGDANDHSPYGNDGVPDGDPIYTADRFGTPDSAILMDGVDDQVVVPDAPSLDLTNAITLAAWVRPAVVGNHWVVGKVNLSGGGFLYSLDYLSGEAQGSFRDALGEINWASGYLPIIDETWQFMVFTWDGEHMLTYVDGVLEGHLARTGTPIGTGDGDVEIGSFEDARFGGVLDDILIMERALTHREIVVLAQ